MSITRTVRDDALILSDGTELVLTMKEVQDDAGVLVSLNGSLRSDTVHDFQDELVALATLGLDMRLDFSKITYLSYACMQALLVVQQKMDSMGRGSLTLIKIPPAILAEMESTGISELLVIED